MKKLVLLLFCVFIYACPTTADRLFRKYSHSLALKDDGTVWGWGENIWGKLGDGTHADTPFDYNLRLTPVRAMVGLTDVVAVSGGCDFSMALKRDGTVWTCGRNLYGELGNGTKEMCDLPVQVVGLSGVTTISGGSYHLNFARNL